MFRRKVARVLQAHGYVVAMAAHGRVLAIMDSHGNDSSLYRNAVPIADVVIHLAQVRSGTLPAARGASGEPRFHRRDVNLYWLGQHLSPGTAHGALRAWRDESDAWNLDPWVESTPG